MPLKPFSLTHVVYSSDDPYGALWALLSLSPPFCVVSVCTQLVVARDLRAAFLLAGLVTASLISTVLKKIIDQPRPSYADDNGMLHVPSSQEEGMPSNHASFVTFAATFAWLFAVRRCHQLQGPAWAKTIKRWVPPLGATVVAVGCCYSRITLNYHTAEQVYAGIGLGSILGFAWYYLYETTYVSRIAPFLEHLLSDLDFRSPHDVGDVAGNWRKSLDARRIDAQRQNGWKQRK